MDNQGRGCGGEKPATDDRLEQHLLVAKALFGSTSVLRIGLAWLTTDNKDTAEFQVLNDYATWHANY